MLLLLIDWLHSLGVKVPAVFGYTSSRMIFSALTTLLCCIFLGPRFIKKLYEWKIGQSIRSVEECPLLAELHEKKKNTPTMGGLLMLFSMLLSLFLWMDLSSMYTWILFFTTIGVGAIGVYDDSLKLLKNNSKGLRGKKKMIGQVFISGVIALYLLCPPVTEVLSFGRGAPSAKEHYKKKDRFHTGSMKKTLDTQEMSTQLYVPFFKKPLILKGWWVLFAFFLFIFVITGSSNAVNLTDGLDGLAAGCLVMCSIVFALIAFLSSHIELSRYLHILYIQGSSEIAVYLFAMGGACLGFLWYNGYPAQVFMGDTGSLSLGAILGVCSILLRREILLAIVGGIFVLEALSVILQVLSYKYRGKKRIFLCAPLHHHFEYKGWPETKIVLRFWIIGLILAILGAASLKFQ